MRISIRLTRNNGRTEVLHSLKEIVYKRKFLKKVLCWFTTLFILKDFNYYAPSIL